MSRQHIWTERDPDGRKREVRATKFGGAWRFQSKFSDEAEWTYYDYPPLEDLLTLRQIISRKYQRRRASADDVTSLEKLIHERQNEGRDAVRQSPDPVGAARRPYPEGNASK